MEQGVPRESAGWREVSAVAPLGPGLRLLNGAAGALGRVWVCAQVLRRMTQSWEALSIRRRIRLSYERNLDDFVDWSDRNKMTFNSAECEVTQSFKRGDQQQEFPV